MRGLLMSIKVMTKVWDGFHRGGSEKLVMLAMADWCNDEGGSLYPSILTIAKKTNISESQARRIVHKFIDEGYLSVIGNSTGGSSSQTRQYQSNLNKLNTPCMGATPSADATPSMGARSPLAPVRDTPSTHDTQYIIEPSIEPPDIKMKNQTLKSYLEECKTKSKKPIPEGSKVFYFSERANIPMEFLTLAWNDFKEKFIDDEVKKQKDWVLTFSNYVKNNWLEIWYFNKENACLLTSKGIGLQNYHKNKVDA